MTTPFHFDRNELRELAFAWMDGRATPAQQEALNELLRSDNSVRDEFLALVDLHACLVTESGGMCVAPENSDHQAAKPPAKLSAGFRGRYVIAASLLAVGLLAAIVWYSALGFRGQTPPRFATVAQLNEASWSSEQLFGVGDAVGATPMSLADGIVRLEFNSGVEVTIQGPAEFEILSNHRMWLASGLLTATAPNGVTGFSVDTPTAEVVDLGTSFGVDLRNGASQISVFDGEVEVTTTDASAKQLLTEGDSVRVGVDREIKTIDFDPKPFEKVWPVSSGIVGSSETFRFVPPWPKRFRFIESDDHIFVAPDGFDIELQEPLQVNISEPGEYAAINDLTPTELPAGARIRSFLLHYSPVGNFDPRNAKRMKGEITFDRPIVGLIVLQEELIASRGRFIRRAAGELLPRRDLEFRSVDGDQISLSADQRTLKLDLVAPRLSSDLIRVICAGKSTP